jgi:dihydroorotase
MARVIELSGTRIVDPGGPFHERRGLRILEGRIQDSRDASTLEADLQLELQGTVVTPGLSDMHVHLREPGDEEAETVETGLQAAAHGGFTRVGCMPNTKPPIDHRAVVDLVLARARDANGVEVHPVAGITKGLRSETLTEMGELREAGVLAVSNDGYPVPSNRIMRRAMEYAKTFDLLVIDHAEDLDLTADGVMNEGYWSTVLGLRGIPTASEEVCVARDIALCRLTGCRLHIAHISTAGTVELIRRAKGEGLPVTGETAPHYFTLTDASLQSYDSNFKMKPPLRTERDVEAILQGLTDGTIDVIATDHAPHTPETKEVELDQAPFGIIGLETSLGLVITHLLMPGRIGLEDLVRLMSKGAAQIMGWGGGTIRPGESADLTVIDPQKTWTVDSDKFASRSRNTPFGGTELHGLAVATVAQGRLVHAESVRATASQELLARAS